MKLYHISTDIDNTTQYFIPKVPIPNAEFEDTNIPRICFSESISGCLSALPPESRVKIEYVGAKFVLYSIDANDYPSSNFMLNDAIVKNNLVNDANITKEAWYLKPIMLSGRMCEVTSVSMVPMLNFNYISVHDIVFASLPYMSYTPPYTNLSSEEYYNLIMSVANENRMYDLLDNLFNDLGSMRPDAQTWETDLHYRYID